MIELRGVKKRFGKKRVLAEVTLSISAGELVILSGPSGAGKTTILEIISGLLRADEGTRSVGAKSLGYCFQDNRLIPWQTVSQNLLFVLGADFSREESKTICSSWLERMGLSSSANLKPGELSGGMQRRLNIARAFAVKADLVLLDEPFAFQDSKYNEIIEETILQRHKAGTTIILVSHEETTPSLASVARHIRITEFPVRLLA